MPADIVGHEKHGGANRRQCLVCVFTTSSDGYVVIDVSQSSCPAAILVGVGISNITCGTGAVSFFATAGTTYYVLAIDYQGDGDSNGGTLRISFNEEPLTSLDEFTVDRFGSVNIKTGVATISGSYTCSNGYFFASGVARQNVGRIATIFGSLDISGFDTCNGLPHSWSANIILYSGKFAGGKAITLTSTYACGPLNCSTGSFQYKVQLHGCH